MKKVLLLLFGIFALSSAQGQNAHPHTIHISGLIKEYHTMTPIPNAEIVVMKNNAVIRKTKADSIGKYRINLDAKEGEKLEINSSAKHHSSSQNLVIVQASIIEDYNVDIELAYQTVINPPPEILFERDEIEHIPFDITMYKELLEDNPLLCVQISHRKHPQEAEKLTKKRLLEFEKFMVENGFRMNQIDLNFATQTQKCPEWAEHCHGQLLFEITSMEGHCLQE